MIISSDEQQKWAIQSWDAIAHAYREWSNSGKPDYSPLLRLIEACRTPEREKALSLGTSLESLIIAHSGDAKAPNRLAEGVPIVGISQLDRTFRITYTPRGRGGHTDTRDVDFADALPVLESFLLRLKREPRQ